MKRTLPRKCVAFFLAFIILSFSCIQLPAMAAYNSNSAVYDKIEATLSAIAPEKELYGLNDINIYSLSIGSEIPAYEVVSESLKPVEIHIYPIFDDTSKLVLTATTANINGEIAVSLSCSFVDTLSCFTPSDKVAIIYDKNNIYIQNENATAQVKGISGYSDMDRDDLASISEDDISSINKATLHNVASLTVNPPIQMYDIGDDSVYLQVEKLKQSTSTLCWAATAVSILRYKGRIDNSISDQKFSELYQSYMGENWSLVGQSTAFVTDFINTYFDKNEGKYVFRGTDWYDYESIWTSLNRDNPVYGEFIYPSQTTTHAMVVRAMNGYGWFGVMDPLVKDYRTVTYTGTGATRDFVVPNEVAGKTLTLIKYSFRS